jgi:myosin heavy subunit
VENEVGGAGAAGVEGGGGEEEEEEGGRDSGVGAMVGASTSFFLLERSRVVQYSPGENNFHVLHQLHQHDEKEELWFQGGGKQYRFLQPDSSSGSSSDASGSSGSGSSSSSSSGNGSWDGQWEDTEHALCTVGLDASDVQQVKHILRTVLLLGNLRFGAEGANERETNDKSSKDKSSKGPAARQRDSLFGGGTVQPGAVDASGGGKAVVLDDQGRPLQALTQKESLGVAESTNEEKKVDALPEGSTPVVLAKALGCSLSVLRAKLTSRTVRAGAGKRASYSTIRLTVEQAGEARNALAKAIYSQLFAWTVDRINAATTSSTATSTGNDGNASIASTVAATNSSANNNDNPAVASIGVLDIFGFENLVCNSLEQLLINLANEELQQLHMRQVLRGEMDQYYDEMGVTRDMLPDMDSIEVSSHASYDIPSVIRPVRKVQV